MSDSRVSRRSLLVAASTVTAAGLAAGLGGCEAGPVQVPAPTEAPPDPLTPVLLGQQALLATYEQTLSAFPEFRAGLSDLQAQTAAHTDALREAAPAAAAQAAAVSPTASGTPTPSARPPTVAAAAWSTLARAVDGTAGTLRAAALRAEGDLAALLGSCAASTASHALLLGS